MAKPSPLPRKYLAIIQEAQDDLRLTAHQMRLVIERVVSDRCSGQYLQSTLLDAESKMYRIAHDLSTIDIADDCDSCPVAPAQTRAVIFLHAMADELEKHAALARETASKSKSANI